MEYGDNQVHFDPIRAVQSIKLSNNYRTARSNDNFLSTVVLNTYFFNNAVVHHDDIKQSPPKNFHYDADDQFSDSSSNDDDDDASSSTYCSSNSYSSEDDDSCSETKTDEHSHSNSRHDSVDLIASHQHNGHSLSSRHKLSSSMDNVATISHQLHRIEPNGMESVSKITMKPGALQHAASNPDDTTLRVEHEERRSHRPLPRHGMHHKHHTMMTLHDVPSAVRHRQNVSKASKILGIHSNAVILANSRSKTRRRAYQYSHSQSKSLQNIGTAAYRKTHPHPVMDDEMKMIEGDDDEEEEEFDDDEEWELSEHEMDAPLNFDNFRHQKRSSDTGRLLMRSHTVDLTNCPPLKDEVDGDAISSHRGHHGHGHRQRPYDQPPPPPPSYGPYRHHQRGITTLNVGDHSGLHDDHHLNPFSAAHRVAPNSMSIHGASSSRRHRLSISKSPSESASDVIEIKVRIDATKRGYLFIGILPANKINVVVQPGFMFGFNAFSHSLHGFSGKLYHDGVQSEYCFSPNNAATKRRNSGSKQRIVISSNANTNGNGAGSTLTPSTAPNSGNRSAAATTTVAVTEDLATMTPEIGGDGDGNGENEEYRNHFGGNEEATTSRTVTVAPPPPTQHLRSGSHSASKVDQCKLPLLQSGDVVTVKMRLNRNNGKFAVIYCINDIDYGVAWKAIDPGFTVGITMVGRSEQITLISCTYRPHKNDKSCVIL